MQVAVNTDKRLNYFKQTGDKSAKQILWKQAGLSLMLLIKFKLMGYGLDDRFTIVSEFFFYRQNNVCPSVESL